MLNFSFYGESTKSHNPMRAFPYSKMKLGRSEYEEVATDCCWSFSWNVLKFPNPVTLTYYLWSCSHSYMKSCISFLITCWNFGLFVKQQLNNFNIPDPHSSQKWCISILKSTFHIVNIMKWKKNNICIQCYLWGDKYFIIFITTICKSTFKIFS